MTPADALADIDRQLTALGNQGACASSYDAQAKWAADHSRLVNRRAVISTTKATLEKLDPLIAADDKWVADVEWARQQLCDRVLNLARPRTDLEKGRQQMLLLSIQMCDRGRAVIDGSGWALETTELGRLLRERGYVVLPSGVNPNGELPFLGSLVVVAERLKELRQRRDEAQRQLDAALREPEPEPVLVTN